MKKKTKDTYTEQASDLFFSGKFNDDEASMNKLAEEVVYPLAKALCEIGELHGFLAMDKIEIVEYYEYRFKTIEKQLTKVSKEIQEFHKRLVHYN